MFNSFYYGIYKYQERKVYYNLYSRAGLGREEPCWKGVGDEVVVT